LQISEVLAWILEGRQNFAVDDPKFVSNIQHHKNWLAGKHFTR
jgi:hypothetical protein